MTGVNLPVDLSSVSFFSYQSFPVLVSAFDDVHCKILKTKVRTNIVRCEHSTMFPSLAVTWRKRPVFTG